MASLGEEIQARIKQNLETEVAFYASRGLINKDEQQLITSTFTEAIKIASSTLPLPLDQRPINLPSADESQNKSLSEKIEEAIENVMVKLGVKAYDTSPWNGAASQWKSPEAYCASCLIDMNEGSGPKTKDKCKLPYKKPGSSSVNVNALRAMASGGRGLPALKGVPKDQVVKAANFMIRHWQGAFNKPAPANIYRLAGKQPPEGSKETQVKFFKDKQGQWWMLGLYSNRWMDRERDIISEAAHKEYADWVNKSGFRPQIVVYHLPKMPDGFWEKVWSKWGDNVQKLNEITKKVFQKTSLGEVDRIVPLNGFSVAVGKIYPEKYEAAEKLAAMQDTGMSHGFLVFSEADPDSFSSMKDTVNIIEKYRSFEMSVLLRNRAANYATAPLFVEEKSVTYRKEDREMIASLLGEEIANALDDNTKDASEVLDAMLEHKELADVEEDSETPKPDEKQEPTPENKEGDKAMTGMDCAGGADCHNGKCEGEDCQDEDGAPIKSKMEESLVEDKVVEAVMKVLNVEQLQTLLTTVLENQKQMSAEIAELKAAKETMADKVKTLELTEDEKIAAKYTPMNWGGVGFSPTKSKGTAIPQDEVSKIVKEGPNGKAFTLGDETADFFLETILNGRKP